jgi:hypothetical protein
MWQLQWRLSLIPDSILSWIYWALIGVGITGIFAGWLARFIPFYGKYVTILKPVGIILVVLGVWLRGGYDVEMAWRAKVAEMQKKVSEAEAQAEITNKAIETKVEVQTKVIREKGKNIVQYIDREVVKKEEIVKYIEQCPVPKEIIDLHNQATELNNAAEGKK